MSNNSKKDLYSKREFLNRGTYHSIAAVGAKLEHDTDDNYQPLSAEFSISNCDRSINLIVDCYDMDDIENSVYKMQQIEETARGMREALLQAKPILEAWLKKEEERKKKEENESRK